MLRLFCFASFLSYAFVEAAVLRSMFLRYAGAPIATRVFGGGGGDFAFSEFFFVPFPLSLCMDYRVYRTFFPSEWCFSTL